MLFVFVSGDRMAVAQIIEIPLRRQDNTQPWGFRLKGGTDQGAPLQIESVSIYE